MMTGRSEGKQGGWNTGKHREGGSGSWALKTVYKQLHAIHNWTQRLSDYD